MGIAANFLHKWEITGRYSQIIVNSYIIAYPPGVPLAVPGDEFTPGLRDELARLRRAGVEVFFINN
jgi:arginine/lysine/ornithine decarboxylase